MIRTDFKAHPSAKQQRAQGPQPPAETLSTLQRPGSEATCPTKPRLISQTPSGGSFSRLQAAPPVLALALSPRGPSTAPPYWPRRQAVGTGHTGGWGLVHAEQANRQGEVGTGPCAGLLWGSLSTSPFCWNLGGSEVRGRKHPAVETSKSEVVGGDVLWFSK